ncbi:MAG: BrnT family toxin [Jannaschia sp.]
MKFEYDAEKSRINAVKHGIDFEGAQALWNDPWLLEAPARTVDEPRIIAIGRIRGRYWVAIWTPRGDMVRIISVRRARREEVDRYESA